MTKPTPEQIIAAEWRKSITGSHRPSDRTFAELTTKALADAGYEINEAGAIENMRERAAQLFERINPASDEERLSGEPGADSAMAILEYRDAIRALPLKDTAG